MLSRSGSVLRESAGDFALLRRHGACAATLRCDVANSDAVRLSLLRIHLPLEGVFHLAFTPLARLLRAHTHEHLLTSFASKAGGCSSLHVCVQKHASQCFVAFSSYSAISGATGAASYTAANSWIESFGMYRRHMGTAGQSVQPGEVGEVGSAARSKGRNTVVGVDIMPKFVVVGALAEVITSLRARVAMMHVCWPDYLKQVKVPAILVAFTRLQGGEDGQEG